MSERVPFDPTRQGPLSQQDIRVPFDPTKQRPFWQEAFAETDLLVEEVLRGQDFSPLTLRPILLATRQATTIMDGSSVNDAFYNLPNGVLGRADDIAFLLNSLYGLSVNRETVERYLRIIGGLEAAFYPIARAKVKSLPWFLQDSLADLNELESHAEDSVARVVWDLWVPPISESREEMIYYLRWRVMVYLSHLEFYLHRLIDFGRQVSPNISMIHLDELDEEEGERNWEEGMLLQRLEPDDISPTDYQVALELWYRAIREKHLSLPQVFYIIERLDPNFQLAMLIKFKLLYPTLKIKEIAKILQIRREGIIRDYFVRACHKGVRAIMATSFTGSEMPSKTIAMMLADFTISDSRPAALKLGSRVINCDSPRYVLLRCRNDPRLISRLTEQERKILTLATSVRDGTFLYSNEKIAEFVGYQPGGIESILTRIARLAVQQTDRYPSADGHAIRVEGFQARLISIKDKLSPVQLAQLSELERAVFDYLTTPLAESGVYPTISMAMEKFGFKRKELPSRILADLQATWAEELQAKILRAKELGFAGFSANEIKMMRYILECLEQGKPLRSPTKGRLNWLEIENITGVPINTRQQLKKKLERLS